ncbi:sperm-associated antigen 5 isoform X2 [Anas acuta]|uniref:sperm-associated antigen 5 isoform X2 n=1 Tax=Anas acuta TaxID=28680 RepID=UPI0035C8A2AF
MGRRRGAGGSGEGAMQAARGSTGGAGHRGGPGSGTEMQRRPLKELRLQPEAESSGLTPLLRRMRLEDRGSCTPVSCARPHPIRLSVPPPRAVIPRFPSLESLSSITPEPSPGAVTPGSPTLHESPPHVPLGAESPELPPADSTPEPPSSATSGPEAPEPPGDTSPEPAPPCSAPPGSPNSIISGPSFPTPPSSTPLVPYSPDLSCPCTPAPPSISSSAPCSPPLHPLSSTSPAPCTPTPPGTSTPQEAPFHGGGHTVPTDLSCSPEGTSDGGEALPACPSTPGTATSPIPPLPEQSPPQNEAAELEPARAEPAATPLPSSEPSPGALSWALLLVWLERNLQPPSPLDSLWHRLPLSVPWRDVGTGVTPVGTGVTPMGTSVTPVRTVAVGTSITPVPTVAVGTSVTPLPTVAVGTSVTPVPTVDTGTVMTPRDPQDRSPGTSAVAHAKDSATETDSLLSYCPREQLRSLSRTELEGRLENALIIIEVLVLQLRSWQESQRSLPSVGPAKQRDAPAQTDITWSQGEEQIYHGLYLELHRKSQALQRQRGTEQELAQELAHATEAMDTWARQGLQLHSLTERALRSLQEDQGALAQEKEQVKALVSRCVAVLQSVPGKLRSCLQERDEAQQRADEALRAKAECDSFLEAFSSHARAQISAQNQSLASQQELLGLLESTIHQQASLAAESQLFRELADIAFANLQEEQRVLDDEWERVRALVSRCTALAWKMPGKLQSCLQEQEEAQQRADETLRAKEEVSQRLEETSAALQDAVAQVEQLTVTNSRLGADLGTLMKQLASAQQERDALQQETTDQKEEICRLTRGRDALQRECGELSQELREATECREFLDQENRMSRRQLMEVEAKLKSTLAELQERSLQHEKLKESHKCLQDKQAALLRELERTKAELQDSQLKREKVSWCLADIADSKLRLQELADCLRASLEKEDDDTPLRSRTWTPAPRIPAHRTPYRAGGSVGSALKNTSGRAPPPSPPADGNEAAGFGSVPQTKPSSDKVFSTPKRAEPEGDLIERVAELRAVVSELSLLSTRIQELEQSEFKALEAKISKLQRRLEKVTDESQERMDDQAATIAKLNKALQGKIQNEKVLQDILKQQEEHMLDLIDKSGEVTRLNGEVSQLRRSLQRAETEAKVLWEEVRGQEPKVDAARVQERILMRQEVDKLRLLLLEKMDENSQLSDKYLEQIQGLELRLQQSQKLLKAYEETQEKMKKVLSCPQVLSVLPAVSPACPELLALLRYLDLKPPSADSEEEAPEPQ